MDVDVPEIIPGKHHFAVVVSGMGRDITNGMRERDVGVRSGGLGCTTLVLHDGHLIMPPDWDLDRESPEYSEYIRSRDIMGPGDALIIGSADDIHTARSSAVNAALNLIRPHSGTQT